jgi:predicted aldo/keto reductase-like oxidoreductase
VYKSLERLQTDYIDCLMIANAENVSELLYEEFHTAAEQLKKEGRVRFIGVAHHGTQQWFYRPEQTMETVLLTAVKDGRFDVILLAYNFLKQDMSEKILDVCYRQNIGITLMKTNPIRGYFGLKNWIAEQDKERTASEKWLNRGRIKLSRLEEKFKSAQSFLRELNLKDPNEIGRAAVRFVLSNPRVDTVCVSYSNYNQVKEFLELSGSRLTTCDKQILAAYAHSLGNFYCRHACGLCERQCPYGVPVNTIMRYDHYFEAQGREKYAMQKYSDLRTVKADLCQTCAGPCEAACPYGVPVQGLLMLAHRNLTMV